MLFIPCISLYSSSSDAFPVWITALSVFIMSHLFSAASVWKICKSGKQKEPVPLYGTCLFVCFSIILVGFSLVVFWFSFPVMKLENSSGSPSFQKGEYILCSRRDSSLVVQGDLVVPGKDLTNIFRCISVDEGAVIDVTHGVITILGDDLPQNVRSMDELEAAGIPANENIFVESAGSVEYYISRDAKGPTESFLVAPGEIFLAPDNRSFSPGMVVHRSQVYCRVERKIPFVNDFFK